MNNSNAPIPIAGIEPGEEDLSFDDKMPVALISPLTPISPSQNDNMTSFTTKSKSMLMQSSFLRHPGGVYSSTETTNIVPQRTKGQQVARCMLSVRFILPAFVTAATVLVTILTITLMSINTQSSVEDIARILQENALENVEVALTKIFEEVSETTYAMSIMLSRRDMDPAQSASLNESLFPKYTATFMEMYSFVLNNPVIISFMFQWRSMRLLGATTGVLYDVGATEGNLWLMSATTPSNTQPILPDFNTQKPIPISSASFKFDYVQEGDRSNGTTATSKMWHLTTSSYRRAFSVTYAVYKNSTKEFLGYLSSKCLFNTAEEYVSRILPFKNSQAFVYEDSTGRVVLLTSARKKEVVTYFIGNMSSELEDAYGACTTWRIPPPEERVLRYTCESQGKQWLIISSVIEESGIKLNAVLVVNEEDVLGKLKQGYETTIIICSVISAVCIILVLSGTFIIGNALTTLQRNLRSVAFMGVEDDNLDVPETSAGTLLFSELRDTQESYITLHNAIKAFHFYVPVNVVRGVLTGTMHSGLGMSQRFLVLSFQDIEKFTTLCEQNRNDPDKVIEIVSPMFEEVSRILTQRHGTIDKYIGDCIMTYWEVGNGGANRGPREACRNAVLAAHASLFVEPLHGVRFRTGIHCGMALLGNFGSAQRFNYTAVGDTVNTASRVESLNKEFHSQALCTERVVQHLSDGDESTEFVARLMEAGIECDGNDNVPPLNFTRYVGKVQVVGKDVAIGMYQIMKRPFEGGAAERQAWEDLIGRRLEKEHAFEAVSEELSRLETHHRDPTVVYLHSQVSHLLAQSVAGVVSYNGVWKQSTK